MVAMILKYWCDAKMTEMVNIEHWILKKMMEMAMTKKWWQRWWNIDAMLRWQKSQIFIFTENDGNGNDKNMVTMMMKYWCDAKMTEITNIYLKEMAIMTKTKIWWQWWWNIDAMPRWQKR